MKLVGRFLALLLAIALAATALAYVAERTIWSATYMQQAASRANVAPALAKQLPDTLARLSGGNPADTKLVLSDVITPAYMDGQLDSLITQLERYYRSGGEVPTLDLRALSARVGDEDIPLPDQLRTTLDTPLAVTEPTLDPTITAASQRSAQLRWAAPVAAVVVIVLILLLAGRPRWMVIAEGLFGGAIATLAVAGATMVIPGLISSGLETSPAQALAPLIKAYVAAVGVDQRHMLIGWAEGFAAAGAVAVVLHIVGKFTHHKGGHAKHGH